MFIRLEGLHCAKLLEEVNLPTDNTQYKKLGEGFLDEEVVNDSVLDWFEQYIYLSTNRSEALADWYSKNKETAWFDLREGEDGLISAAAGDTEGLKFLDTIYLLTIDYDGYEINVESTGDLEDKYIFTFWIDPEGGILRSCDDERDNGCYEGLACDGAIYLKKDYSFEAALKDLVANSDKYQRFNDEEDEEEKNKE